MDEERVQFPIGVVIGKDGKSAYQVACENDFEGSEIEWLESLKANILVDTVLSDTSTNPVQNKVVAGHISALQRSISQHYNLTTELQKQMGDIDTALDAIIVIQNALIGGDAV